jgi:disulfide bond formation protein DsbB
MINTASIINLERLLNLGGVAGILSLLIVTLVMQFGFFDLPCPLCLLQRIGFFGMALGFILNLRYGFRPSHYAVVLISALFTAFIALRQIALHVIPDTGVYGMAIFEMHLYTWSFIVSVAAMVITTLLLSVDRQYEGNSEVIGGWRKVTNFMFLIFLSLLLINIGATFMLCGFQACESDPIYYKLFS